MATIDIKDMFFMVPLQPGDRDQFAFVYGGNHIPLLGFLRGTSIHPP